MKNRKQKQPQPKKVTLTSEESPMRPLVTMNHKLIQEHIKKSSNHTIHSKTAGHVLGNQKDKNIKYTHSASKQKPLSTTKGCSASKRGQKFKAMQQTFKRQTQRQNKNKNIYRQYCVVDEKFVPITNIQEQHLYDQFLSRTAANTNDFNYFEHVQKTTLKDDSRVKLKKVSLNNEDQKNKDQIIKYDKATSSLQKKRSFKAVEIEVKAQCTEIGMQYSQRKLVQQQKIETHLTALGQNQKIQTQSLTDLLFQLQFGHLGNESAFKNLSTHQKEHFSQLLETLIVKLKPEEKEIVKLVQPLSFDSAEAAITNKNNCQQEPKQKRQQSAAIPFFINYDNLQNLITVRQYRQMSWIEDPTNYQTQDRVNTSLFSVVNFLCHFFCYIEVQYTEQFVYMIKKMYGLTFREKYRRITRKIPINMEKNLFIIDESIFLDFIDENSQTICNSNEIAHLRAIFDAFNEHLEQYRPFYFGNGQQFPWSLQMFITMSEYSIDEDSLHIIFRQAKQKIIQWASTLCGIIVEHNQQVMLPNNPMEAHEYQKENILILTWLKEQNFEKDEVQNFSTQVLHEMAQSIYQQLIQEFIAESQTNFNN